MSSLFGAARPAAFGGRLLAMTLAGTFAAGAALADCAPAPEPIVSLDFASRYAEDDESRSELDSEAAAAAEDALRPVEDFLRDLTEAANEAADRRDATAAACVMEQMAEWARADALSDLGGGTAELTIGSRFAGLSLVFLQLAPLVGTSDDAAEVRDWLDRRIADQIAFWETEAPDGARQGNLRAWAALAAAARGADRDGPNALRFAFWAGASASYVLCTADRDGSLPQEMRRGSRALQYQLHAIAPLAVTSLLLDHAGMPLAPVCDGALDRAVGFALNDLKDEGRAAQAITGQTQTFFDGKDTIEGFHLAWVTAYLKLPGMQNAELARDAVSGLGVLSYSKLGGNQMVLWEKGF